MDLSSAWDSAFSEWWISPARGISLFPSDGALQRVGFCNSRAVDRSHAWDFSIPERWNSPARELLQFPSGGLLSRVGLHIFREMEIPCPRGFSFPEQLSTLSPHNTLYMNRKPSIISTLHDQR